MKSVDEIHLLLQAGGGVIARHEHPDLRGSLEWLVRTGRLASVLPGVYARPEAVRDPMVRMSAVARRHPDAVLLGGAAARLTYWPQAPLDRIEVAVADTLRDRAGFTFTRRHIPPELVLSRGGLRVSTPDLTAIDLATTACADAIDTVLRTRRGTLAGMYEALRLTPNRPGNLDRRRLLLDSRNEPWSAAEREAHRILRAARLGGWKANWAVEVDQLAYFIDIAFRFRRLALEVDGRLHETDEDIFENDRWRQNALVLDGWRVLRVTWTMLQEHPDLVVANLHRALRG